MDHTTIEVSNSTVPAKPKVVVDAKPESKLFRKRLIIVFLCVGLLVVTLAVGAAMYALVGRNDEDGSSNDGADEPVAAPVEVNILINIHEDDDHRLHTPIPNHTFTQLAATAVGSTATVNVAMFGGNLSEPTGITYKFTVVEKRQEGTRKLSNGAPAVINGSAHPADYHNFTRLMLFQLVDEDNQDTAIPVLGKNITSVSCVVGDGDVLSMCDYHDSQEHLERRLLAPAVIIVGAVAIIVLGTVVVGWYMVSQDKGCFPGSAQVFTPDGTKTMSALKVSDLVLTHDGYSPISFFGHYDPLARSEMVQITTALGQSLALTADHYVPFANGTYATARNVQQGDAVWVMGELGKMIRTVVMEIKRVVEIGLYNPYPYIGTIVVNGILASAHSSWLLEGMIPETHIPATYDALLTPIHFLHRIFPGWLERFADNVAGIGSLDEKGVVGIAHAAMVTMLK